MRYIPTITATLTGTNLELNVFVDASLFPSRHEWLISAAEKYFVKNPKLTRIDAMRYLLWLIRDKDNVVFTFGDNPWNYVQFTKKGENLILDFPYNNRFGNRQLQVDKVELILKHYGFTRFITQFAGINTLHYDDYCFSTVVTLQASFGNKRNDLAIEIMYAIVSEVFLLPLNSEWSIRLGSERE